MHRQNAEAKGPTPSCEAILTRMGDTPIASAPPSSATRAIVSARRVPVAGEVASALMRQLLADYFSESTITFRVDPKTRELFDTVVSMTSATDEDMARELKPVLKRLLDTRLENLAQLRRRLDEE